MNTEKTVLALALSISFGLAQMEATGAAAASVPTPKRLVELAKQAKVVESGQFIEAAVNGAEADIRTGCTAQDTEKDLKIDAVLIAKSILTAYKGQITRVKVIFSCQRQNPREVIVTQGDVIAFGSGQMSEKDLFSSLAITESGTTPADRKPVPPVITRVAAGPFWFERYSLLRQIDTLKAKGSDVKQFQEMFDKAQLHAVAKDPDATKQDVQALQTKLAGVTGATDVSAPPGFGNVQPGPPVAPWFAMARFQVGNKIRQMKTEGQDVSEFHHEMQHLNRLVQQHRMDDASELLKRLQAQLGILKSDQ